MSLVEDGCGCPRRTCRIGPDDPRHGTYNGYGNHGCGCDRCKQANARYCYNAKLRRKAKGCPPSKHGTAGGYGNWGCRCEACTAAWAQKAFLQRLYPS